MNHLNLNSNEDVNGDEITKRNECGDVCGGGHLDDLCGNVADGV